MADIVRVTEGLTLEATESFLDEFDEPLLPSLDTPGPVVRLYDNEKEIIAEAVAIADDAGEPGDWRVSIPVPILNLSEAIQVPLVWEMLADTGDRQKSKQIVVLEPANEGRLSDIVVIIGQDDRFEFVLPMVPHENDILKFGLFTNNKALYKDSFLTTASGQVSMESYVDRSIVSLPNVIRTGKLEPHSLLVRHLPVGALTPVTYTYKLWAVTPQVLIAASLVEDFINKARLENVIPELEYTQPDLVQYLSRGLSLFNMMGPQITAFNGNNMQGVLLDCWVICACYYALGAQLQAEGALAFDFSGQSVSLNIDRSPAIEGALSRIENQFETVVKPAKKLMSRYGVISGDGSQGGQFMDGSRALGRLTITNSPTSIVGSRGRGRYRQGTI